MNRKRIATTNNEKTQPNTKRVNYNAGKTVETTGQEANFSSYLNIVSKVKMGEGDDHQIELEFGPSKQKVSMRLQREVQQALTNQRFSIDDILSLEQQHGILNKSWDFSVQWDNLDIFIEYSGIREEDKRDSVYVLADIITEVCNKLLVTPAQQGFEENVTKQLWEKKEDEVDSFKEKYIEQDAQKLFGSKLKEFRKADRKEKLPKIDKNWPKFIDGIKLKNQTEEDIKKMIINQDQYDLRSLQQIKETQTNLKFEFKVHFNNKRVKQMSTIKENEDISKQMEDFREAMVKLMFKAYSKLIEAGLSLTKEGLVEALLQMEARWLRKSDWNLVDDEKIQLFKQKYDQTSTDEE